MAETKKRIALVGYGNIARSLLKGLLAADYEANRIHISNPTASKFDEINRQNKEIRTFSSNLDVIEDATTIILCVKPGVVQTVCEEIKDALVCRSYRSTLLISVAAGVSTGLLEKWTSKTLPIIRCMPNTPSAVGCGMTALYANQCTDDEHKKTAEDIFSTLGSTVWLDKEKDMHIVTALSGSGPAYFFRLCEAFEKAAEQLGCPSEITQKLVIQTLYGAAELALKEHDLAALRKQITSKGGTTERGLQVLEQAEIDEIAHSVLKAAASRSTEISNQLKDA